MIALESIIIIIPIVIYLVKKRYSKAKNNIILSLMLILAGAIGNLIDILFRGYVIDFINIANSMNCNLSDVFFNWWNYFIIYICNKTSHKQKVC